MNIFINITRQVFFGASQLSSLFLKAMVIYGVYTTNSWGFMGFNDESFILLYICFLYYIDKKDVHCSACIFFLCNKLVLFFQD